MNKSHWVYLAAILLALARPAHGAKAGTILWEFQAEGSIHGPPAVDGNGQVYFSTQNSNRLYALDARGRERWKVPAPVSPFSVPTIGNRGSVYVTAVEWTTNGGFRGKVYAFGKNGTKRWELPTAGSLDTSAALGPDGTLYIGANEGTLFAVAPNGMLKWTFSGGDWVLSEPSIGRRDTVYLSFGADWRYANALTPRGDSVWQAPAPAEFPTSFAIDEHGRLYFGVDRGLEALNQDGTLRWHVPMTAFTSSAPTIGRNGRIYVIDGTTLRTFTAAGAARWQIAYTNLNASADGGSLSLPAHGRNGMIYLGAGKQVVALRPNGSVAWRFQTAGFVTTPIILSRHGILYFGTDENKVYAVHGNASTPRHGWPMFRHDAQGTSNVTH